MASLATPSRAAKPFRCLPLNRSIHKPAQTIFINEKPNYHDSARNVLRSSNLNVLKANNRRAIVPIVSAALTQVPESEENSIIGRIFLSDVVVKRRRNVFWGRKWNSMDIVTAGAVVAMHLLSLFAPFTFNWGAFWTAAALYVITGLLGITLSFHRNLSHKSFKLPKWLEYFFAYCGVQALQVSQCHKK